MARQLIDKVRGTARGHEVRVLVGGYALNVAPEVWRGLGADGSARDADEAIQLVERLGSRTSPPELTSGPIAPEAVAAFDRVRAEVEEAVVLLCLAEDAPESSMGPAAESMVRTGLGFVSKMVRAAMTNAAPAILDDQVQWGAARLPHLGAAAPMVLKNFVRYARALEQRLEPQLFRQVRPYVEGLVQRQTQVTRPPPVTSSSGEGNPK